MKKQTLDWKTKAFNNYSEFVNYILNTPYNNVFEYHRKSSTEGTYTFTGTESFEEALNLLKTGWTSVAKEIEKKLKAKIRSISHERTRKSYYDVVGGQASVPRYLQGIPTNMVNQKIVAKKQKVINVYKNVTYAAFVKTETIKEESVKALEIVRAIEATGSRVNLFIIMGAKSPQGISFSIKIKSANERLNISKVAFPMVHPSMLRRLYFRMIEVFPGITDSDFRNGYGLPAGDELKELIPEGAIFLPNIIGDKKPEEILAGKI